MIGVISFWGKRPFTVAVLVLAALTLLALMLPSYQLSRLNFL